MNIAWQSMKTIIVDLIVASAVSAFILWLDNVSTSSDEKKSEGSNLEWKK